jgi:dTDP-4-dehydrorhamnose reductase
MRILILGGDGMLGHQLLRHFGRGHDVRVTLHRDAAAYAGYGLFDPAQCFFGVDVVSRDGLAAIFDASRPDAVINAVGIVKQRDSAKAGIPSIEINALLPHRVVELCRGAGARLIHVSTDCVFSGNKGNYRETDTPDADDLYGRSKLLGEVNEPPCLTLRTSIIGPELSRKTGLIEWFLAQQGPIKGYRRAIFSGLTTMELARVIERMLVQFPGVSGLYHVSSDPISKYDLLTRFAKRIGKKIDIVPDDQFQCDRSLDSSRFRREFAYTPPSWDTMIDELADIVGNKYQ